MRKKKLYIVAVGILVIGIVFWAYYSSTGKNTNCLLNSDKYYHHNSDGMFLDNDYNCFELLLNKEDKTIFQELTLQNDAVPKSYGYVGLYYLIDENQREEFVLQNLNHSERIEVKMSDLVDEMTISELLLDIALDELPDSCKTELLKLPPRKLENLK
jgi:hypothetical protein